MGVYRVPIKITAPGVGACNNTWHLRTTGLVDTDQTNIDQAITALRAFYSATLLLLSPTGTTIEADAAINVEDATDKPVTWAKMTSAGGANVSPSFLAVVVNWKTSSRTRRGRGRTFVGPLVSTIMQGDGTPLDQNVTAIGTAANTLVTASMVDNGWAFGVYGLVQPTKVSGVPLEDDPPRVLRDFLGYAINDRFGYLSSRRP